MFVKTITTKTKTANGTVETSYFYLEVGELHPGQGDVRISLGKDFSIQKENQGFFFSLVEGTAPLTPPPGMSEETVAMIRAKAGSVRAEIENRKLHGSRKGKPERPPKRKRGRPPKEVPGKEGVKTPVYVEDLSHESAGSLGAEKAALNCAYEVKLPQILRQVGFSVTDATIALAVIVARMIHPASDRETYRWLTETSALGILMDIDFGSFSEMKYYRITDKLWESKCAIDLALQEPLANPGANGSAADAGLQESLATPGANESAADAGLQESLALLGGNGSSIDAGLRESLALPGTNVSAADAGLLLELTCSKANGPAIDGRLLQVLPLSDTCGFAIDVGLRQAFPPPGKEEFREPETFSFDISNTHFEGQAEGNPLAAKGHSKTKRFDCKLVSFSLLIRPNGSVRFWENLPGNVSEPSVLMPTVESVGLREGDTILFDKGAATAKNLERLDSAGINFVASGRMTREKFNFRMADVVSRKRGNVVRAYRVIDRTGKWAIVYRHSTSRARSDLEFMEKRISRFLKELKKLADGLLRPRTTKDIDHVHKCIGRLLEKHGVGQYFDIEVVTLEGDPSQAAKITWSRKEVPGSKAECPGVTVIVTNNLSLTAAEVVRLYESQVEIEEVFRCLKKELGLRPIYHSSQDRTCAHIYISILAYQLVNYMRRKLKEADINDSWTTVRNTMETCRLVVSRAVTVDGEFDVVVYRSTSPILKVTAYYRALGLGDGPGILIVRKTARRKREAVLNSERDGPLAGDRPG
jgi:transposase